MLSPPPANSDPDSDDEQEQPSEDLALTQTYLLKSIQSAQLSDLLLSSSSSSSSRRSAAAVSQRAALARLHLDMDKALLQLLAVECREGGEARGMRALEIVRLMRDRSGRMFEAARKVAERYGMGLLGDKIRELAEKRAEGVGSDDDDDGGEEEGRL